MPFASVVDEIEPGWIFMTFASVAAFDEPETLFRTVSGSPGRVDPGRFSYALLGELGADPSWACREGLPIAS